MIRRIFDVLLNVLWFVIIRKNIRLYDCIILEKVFIFGLYYLVYGNSYESIGLNFNVGRLIVLEVV